jgi:hypothetical protein
MFFFLFIVLYFIEELEQTNLSVDKQSFSNFPMYDLLI